MKKALASIHRMISLLTIVLFSGINASTQQWTLGEAFGSNTGFVDAGQAIATDASGNVYVTGKFNTSIDFHNGTPVLVANATGVKTDGFVAKFNSSGACQWSVRFGGPATDIGGLGIATNGTMVWVTGGANFPCTIGAGAPIAAVGGSSDGIVFALDAITGATVWAKAFGGAPAGDRGQAICLDPTGDVYLSGNFFTRSTDAVQASFGTAGLFTRSVQGNMAQSTSDLFVAKISGATGAFVWVSSGGAVSSPSPLTIGNDNNSGSGIVFLPALNEVAVTGSFTNANAVYSTTVPVSSVSLTNVGMSDICLLELNAIDGSFLSGASAGGTTNDEGLAFTTDGTNTFLAGYFNSATVSGAFSLTNTGSSTDDIFYAAYDPATNAFPWVKNAGSSSSDAALGIAVRTGGMLYVSGRYQGTASFPTGAAPLTTTSAGFDDIYLLKVDPASGNASFLATGASAPGGDFGFGVATAPSNKVWLTGSFFTGPITLAPVGITFPSSGDDDVLLARLNDPPAPPPTVFYSKSSGELQNLATWGSNADGSGTNPSDFGAGKTFNLANRAGVYTMTADWTVGGIINNPAGSELQISGFTLSEAGMSGTGTLTGSPTSSLIITGTTGGDAGTLSFTPGGQTLKNFMLDRTGAGASATLSSPLEIYNSVGADNGTFHTADMLTLNSDAFNTARVLPLPSVTSISDKVTVERYIPARRAWRILSSTVWGGVTINQAWQEGTTNVSPNPNPFPGFGTHITGGPIFGSAANGFDQNPGAASSIKSYNSTLDSWKDLPNTNATPVGLQAYMIFIRGDRGIALGPNSVPPTPTTLRAKGPIWIGDYTQTVNATGFTAVPNPFASPVDFATMPKSNVQNSVWLWDPKMGGANGVGAYVNVSFNGTGWDVTPASVSPESQIIQNGQGFLVKTIAPAPGMLIIREADKSPTPNMDVFRTARNSSSLRINLQAVNGDGSTALLDEVFSSYSGYFSSKVDQMDASKMPNVEENLAILNGNELLMVERRKQPAENDEIALKLWNTHQKDYVLEFTPDHLSTALPAWVIDSYLQTATAIPLDKVSNIHFSINTDAASAAADRFRIVFSTKKPEMTKDLITGNFIRVYPNPLEGRMIRVEFRNTIKGSYQLQVVNSLGQVVFRKTLQYNGGNEVQQVPLGKKLSKGVYQLLIKSDATKSTTNILID